LKRLALASLVGANLLVALQVLRHDWDYYETILIFWCEALILGACNVLRLLLVGLLGERPLGETVARWVEFSPGFRVLATAVGIAFFACKFGMFALGVGLLVMALPAFSAPPGSGGSRVFAGLTAAGPGVAAAVAGLVLSHGVSFVRNFVIGREYRRSTPGSAPGLSRNPRLPPLAEGLWYHPPSMHRRLKRAVQVAALRPGRVLRDTLRSGYSRRDLRADLMAGAIVGIVALPLSMALAIASGVPPSYDEAITMARAHRGHRRSAGPRDSDLIACRRRLVSCAPARFRPSTSMTGGGHRP
jgi:hypothetical protein